MAENWHSLVYFLVEKFCFINRQIDAAVAAGILVDGSAEFTSPACVMETDAAVEWHPIVYVTFIFICAVCPFGAAQNAVGLLVGQAVNTFRGCVVFGYVSGYARSILGQGAVFIHIYMLGAEINFCVGIAPVCV